MKNILIFGAGERGRELVDQYLNYKGKNKIIAIVDNHPTCERYQDIPLIKPNEMKLLSYDEIWVCTIYYPQVKKQLMEEYGVSEKQIVYVEPVMPILDERLRLQYDDALLAQCEKKSELSEVLDYIKSNPVRMYCYPFYDEYVYRDTTVYYDEDKEIYYCIHNGKRMYFSRKIDTEQKARCYYNAIAMEQDERSPHCYWNGACVKESTSGVVIDVGAAEGIFSLDMVETAKHIYLIEIEKDWIEALQYTFEPYQEKVTIIQKFVSDFDDEKHCRLDSVFKNIAVDCIKMDIEGVELQALKGAEGLLKEEKCNLAVCTYHHQEDNERITAYLNGLGYQTENSKGYILCQGAWELERNETDFRRGLLFARKIRRECK